MIFKYRQDPFLIDFTINSEERQIKRQQIFNMQLVRRLAQRFSEETLRGKYLQGKYASIQRWQAKLSKKCKTGTRKVVPQIEAFKAYIRNDPVAKMYLQGGLDQIPEYVTQFYTDESGKHLQKPRRGISYGYTWEQLLDQWAVITYSAPEYSDVDIIGVPFYALVIDLLNTDFGRTFFAMDDVDRHLKPVYNVYGKFLDTPESRTDLVQGKWLNNERVNYDEFVGVDRNDVHYGFPSWHAWFTREVKEEARPFNPDAKNEIINNSEYYPNFNMPYNNVEWHDKFWLKDQRYSLAEMFGVDALPAAQQAYFRNEFEGGTVFQGFLNPWCYHRWRAPVGGKLERAYTVGNSYYAGNPSLSFHLAESYIASQPLLTMTSVRQIYVIETGLANIGKVAIIEIGMAEVSGIKSVVTEGQTVKKGDLLGWFRFGGSSHAIIFSNKARNLKFSDAIYERKFNPVTRVHDSVRQKVRSVLATVS